MKTGFFKSIAVFMLMFSLISFMQQIKAESSTIVVDGTLPSNCSTNNYSVAQRACTGGDGNAYKTIREGVQALVGGMTLHIRAGKYNDVVKLGAFSSMVTIAAYPKEDVTWENDNNNFSHVSLAGTANNITFRDIHFVGRRYFDLNRLSWQRWEGNIWRTTSPFAEVIEIKTGCDAATFQCKKSVRSYSGEMRTNPQDLRDAGTDGDYYQEPAPNRYLYVYSASGNPASRTDMWETGFGITIGNNSSETGFIVIDRCSFDGNGHVHLKGGYRWWVKNSTFKKVGTDWNDHHIYSWGVHKQGQEAIYENNYYENDSVMGAAIHIYGTGSQAKGVAPQYHIIRNNIFRGNGFWGVLLDGGHSQVVNNSMYLQGGNRAINLQTPLAERNIIKNNIFVDPEYAAVVFEKNPRNNIVSNNIASGGQVFTVGACDGCTITNNKPNTAPGWVNNQPQNWFDFRLTDGSPAIDAGEPLGPGFENAFSPAVTIWPPDTAKQSSFGHGWEIGAFVYASNVRQ